MRKLNEDLLQFIWQHKLLQPLPFYTVSGKPIEIVKFGELNSNSGPDFFNARIKIDNVVLAGNIEIHVNTSDWLKHNHTNNKSYDNLILHVVYEHDKNIQQNETYSVEVLELKNLIDDATIYNYEQIMLSTLKLPCGEQLNAVSDEVFSNWLQRLAVERLEQKMQSIKNLFEYFRGDYSQTFYTLLLRNFGFKINAEPFELLAKHLPLSILLKHNDSLFQTQALLFGVAGFLDDQFKEPDIIKLQNEFEYLKNKYKLIQLNKHIFKLSKMRPANFPGVRLAQVATLLCSSAELFMKPFSFKKNIEIKQKMQIKLSGYWRNHYTLHGEQSMEDLNLGSTSIENCIINTFAPFYIFYGKQIFDESYTEMALDFLAGCKPEVNSKTKYFVEKRNIISSANFSQGVIQLYNNYCSHKKCLKCAVAASLLKPEKI
jgi:hypothetical protein